MMIIKLVVNNITISPPTRTFIFLSLFYRLKTKSGGKFKQDKIHFELEKIIPGKEQAFH